MNTKRPIYRTAGELKAALADVPDDTPLGGLAGGGGMIRPFMEGGLAKCRSAGRGADKMFLFASDPFFKGWKGVKSKPYDAEVLF